MNPRFVFWEYVEDFVCSTMMLKTWSVICATGMRQLMILRFPKLYVICEKAEKW